MSKIDDIFNILGSAIKLYKAVEDLWGKADRQKKESWLKAKLDEAFSGRHYNPDKYLLGEFAKIRPETTALDQIWISDPWAYSLYMEKKKAWDEMIAKQGNPALIREISKYAIILIVVGFVAFYTIKKIRK